MNVQDLIKKLTMLVQEHPETAKLPVYLEWNNGEVSDWDGTLEYSADPENPFMTLGSVPSSS